MKQTQTRATTGKSVTSKRKTANNSQPARRVTKSADCKTFVQSGNTDHEACRSCGRSKQEHIKVTAKESAMLTRISQSEYRSGYSVEQHVWTFSVSTSHSDAAVLGSLERKGLVTLGGGEDTHPDGTPDYTVALTLAGADVIGFKEGAEDLTGQASGQQTQTAQTVDDRCQTCHQRNRACQCNKPQTQVERFTDQGAEPTNVKAHNSQTKPATLPQPPAGQVMGYAYRCLYCQSDLALRWVNFRGGAQQEHVHVNQHGEAVPACGKSPLAKYLSLESKSSYSEAKDVNKGKGGIDNRGKGAVHLKRESIEQDTLGRPMVTICGALGGRTSVSMTQVTCSNCKRTHERTTKMTEATGQAGAGTATTKPMTVKEKIAAAAAAAAAKAAGKGVGAGKSANLVSKDGPLPKTVKTKAAAKADNKEKLAKLKEAKKKDPINPCGCGCGTLVAGRFSMGHDARFHGWIKRVGDGRMSIAELPEQVRRGMFAGVKDLPEATRKEGKGVNPKVAEAHYLESLKKN